MSPERSVTYVSEWTEGVKFVHIEGNTQSIGLATNRIGSRRLQGKRTVLAAAEKVKQTESHDPEPTALNEINRLNQTISPSEAKGYGDYVRRNPVVSSVVIPELRVYFGMTLAQSECEPSANILTKRVRTAAPRDEVHSSDGATIPPRPIRIADDARAGCRGFSRAMVPADTTNGISSKCVTQWETHDRVESPGILSRTCARRPKECLGC